MMLLWNHTACYTVGTCVIGIPHHGRLWFYQLIHDPRLVLMKPNGKTEGSLLLCVLINMAPLVSQMKVKAFYNAIDIRPSVW